MVGFSAPAAERPAAGVSLLLWPVRQDECLYLARLNSCSGSLVGRSCKGAEDYVCGGRAVGYKGDYL
jgi:hypothetical protein